MAGEARRVIPPSRRMLAPRGTEQFQGVTETTIQELLGHESFAMTLRYAHLSPDVRRDAVQLLDGPAGARGTRVAPSTQQ